MSTFTLQTLRHAQMKNVKVDHVRAQLATSSVRQSSSPSGVRIHEEVLTTKVKLKTNIKYGPIFNIRKFVNRL